MNALPFAVLALCTVGSIGISTWQLARDRESLLDWALRPRREEQRLAIEISDVIRAEGLSAPAVGDSQEAALRKILAALRSRPGTER